MCSLRNSGTHMKPHMSWYVPGHSSAFSQHHLPYLKLLESPHVSFVFPGYWEAPSLLTWPLCIALFNWDTPRFCQPVNQSVSQLGGSQSIHKLRTPATDAHSQKKKKKKFKSKKKHPGEEYPVEGSSWSTPEESGVWFLGLSVQPSVELKSQAHCCVWLM